MSEMSIHPTTVTALSRGEVTVPKTRRRRARTRAVVEEWGFTVDRLVWDEALRLADGDSSRIEIESRTSIVVHNPGWQR